MTFGQNYQPDHRWEMYNGAQITLGKAKKFVTLTSFHFLSCVQQVPLEINF